MNIINEPNNLKLHTCIYISNILCPIVLKNYLMIASSTQRPLFVKTYSKMGMVDHEINKQAETREIGR